MNATIAAITLRGMLGRKRVLLLLILPATLLLLAIAIRLAGQAGTVTAPTVLQRYGLATLLPLVALVAGTGVLGPEIDDGSIAILLATPIPRAVILHTKLGVAICLAALFAALPILIAGLVLVGTDGGFSIGFTAGALAGSIAYCSIFLLINVLSRHAVVISLMYALIWEGLIGGFVPGARELSVQQWALSVADAFTSGHALHSEVPLVAGLVLLAGVTIAATAVAGQSLRSLSLSGDE